MSPSWNFLNQSRADTMDNNNSRSYPMNNLGDNEKSSFDAGIYAGPVLNINQENSRSNGTINERTLDHTSNPTQLVCLNTTVPQNIAARSLGDKHTPTRNSLRHSRMIVMNRHGKVPRKYLPFIIRNYKLVKSMKVFTIILGTVMCMFSAWFVLWTPTLTSMDYPYWSAIPVFFSGVVGCVFLGFCPRPYPGRKLGLHYQISKFSSVLTTCISIMTAVMVLIMAVCHLLYLYNVTCAPHDKFNTTCVCSSSNSTSRTSERTYHYKDLTCDDLEITMKPLLMTSSSLNLLAIILEVAYLYVHWTSARKYVYTKVPLRGDVGNSER